MKRLNEFDILKGLAITAVIIIHNTGNGTTNFDTYKVVSTNG